MLPIGAWCQENISDTLQFGEVVVTASKIPQPLRETTKPVLVIDRADIEQNAGKDLAQLLDEQVGIIINGAQSNPGKDKGLYLRGASSTYTLLLVDGIPVSDPSGVGGAIDLRLFALDQVERIEVLKGSQSTLYGTDAIAGVINIITRKKSPAPIALNAAVAGGSYGAFQAGGGLSGTLGKALNYFADYRRNQSDGISEATVPGGDADGFVQHAAQVRVNIPLGKALQIAPFFQYTDYKSDTDADAFTDGAGTYTSRLMHPGAQAQVQFGHFQATAAYGFTGSERAFNTEFGVFNYKGLFHQTDVFATYGFGKYYQLLGGINGQQFKVETDGDDADYKLWSPYLTLMLRNWHGLSMELGYRLNLHAVYGNNSTYSIAPAYRLNDRHKVFASYTTGFKAPTLDQLYGIFGANPHLKPEQSSTWEVAWASQWLDDRLQTQVTYFQRSIEDIILFFFFNGYTNAGKQNDHGAELELKWQLSPQWTIQGQYAYLDGEITSLTDLAKDTTFYNLIRRPKHRVGLGLQYHPMHPWSLQLHAQYNAQRDDYFYNPANFYTLETVKLSPYWLVNFRTDYQLFEDRLRLFVELRNITDADFTEIYGYNTLGFNVLAGVHFEWLKH